MSVRRLADKQPARFAFTPDNLAWARAQIAKYPQGRQQSAVIPILWRAQEQCGGWLPQKAIEATAELLGMPNIRVLEVATFYTMFNLAPIGRFHVQLCGTTPCMLRGADELKKVCHRIIGEENEVTADGVFSWIEVECLGACVNAPMVQINADYYEDLTRDSFTRIINDLSAGRTPKPGPQIDRINSAPVGGPTTLTDASLFATNGRGRAEAAALPPDDQAKKPGDSANLRDAPMPKPPEADATDPRRK
jgi:NADH-quinone oxidoreductase subunit E